MDNREQGEEKRKEEHVKHGPDVKKQISPAFEACPRLLPLWSKWAVILWSHQVKNHGMRDKLAKQKVNKQQV